jgi:hypothetical protein
MRKKLRAMYELFRCQEFMLLTKDFYEVHEPISNADRLSQLDMMQTRMDDILNAVMVQTNCDYEGAYN